MRQPQKLSAPPDDACRDIIFTPNDAVTLAVQTIQERRSTLGVGVKTGLSCIDDVLLPCRPGDLVTVLGLTSNYKSGFMRFWARGLAEELERENATDQAVVFITWEEAVEEMVGFDLAYAAHISATDLIRGNIDDEGMRRLLEVCAPKRAMLPLYIIGHSVSEKKKRPHLTLSAVAKALQLVRSEFAVAPRAIFLDYLQLIRGEEGDDRRMQTWHTVQRCKDMALAMRCPVIVGSQVNRTVAQRKWALPTQFDGLESSAIEQSSDKMFSTWLPQTTLSVGEQISPPGRESQRLEIYEGMLLVKIAKQRAGKSGVWWEFRVEADKNQIYEQTRVNLNFT